MPSINVQQARSIILDKLPVMQAETIPVKNAFRRVLAQDIVSPANIPAYTNSAMDGFALKTEWIKPGEPAKLDIAGEALAGHPYAGPIQSGQTIRITTGAAVPDWCDAVIPFERVEESSGAIIVPPDAVKSGANIRHQGELIEKGCRVLQKGRRLTRADTALIASLGIAQICVAQTPVVSLIVTGDELVAPGQECPPGKIYDANSGAIQTLIESSGGICQNFGLVADNLQAMSQVLEAAASVSHMIILSGGAADSKADFSHQLISSRGQIEPWTVSMRPGRPMRFAMLAGIPVFILPGNPTAAFVTFLEFARGALLSMQGAQQIWPEEIQAVAECDIKSKPGRAEFARGTVRFENGRVLARPLANQSSAGLIGLSQCNAILAIGPDDSIQAGGAVRAQLLSELIS